MPFYKTVSLRIYRPSQGKMNLLDDAVLRYTRALEFLLRACQKSVVHFARGTERATRSKMRVFVTAEKMRSLNQFDVQPFKDSLKQDFVTLALGFITRFRKMGEQTSYPCIRLESDEADKQIHTILECLEKGELSESCALSKLDSTFTRINRLHSLYFGRYALNRDFCLLYNKETNRFLAKLYLVNTAHHLPAHFVQDSCMVAVAPGMPPMKPSHAARRFIIVPLAFGREQEQILHRALNYPKMLHTARLVRRKDAYDLILSVEVLPAHSIVSKGILGIVRSFEGICAVFRGQDQAEFEQYFFPSEKNLFKLAKKIIDRASFLQAQVVLESNGGRGDGLAFPGAPRPFSAHLYEKLAQILQYKLIEVGLPAPIFLSGIGLNSTCPRCGASTQKNRLTREMFACIKCGYATEARFVGGYNLAKRPQQYAINRVPIYLQKNTDGSCFCFNKILEFSCVVPSDEEKSAILYQLSLMIRSQDDDWYDGKKYAMLCKLRSAENLQDAVRWVKVRKK